MKLKIKTGDTVRVIAGDHKGEEGRVSKIITAKGRVVVEGVNMVSKHTKPSAQNPQGGIEKMEAPINISNVMLLVDGVATRIGVRSEDGKKIRFSKKTDKAI